MRGSCGLAADCVGARSDHAPAELTDRDGDELVAATPHGRGQSCLVRPDGGAALEQLGRADDEDAPAAASVETDVVDFEGDDGSGACAREHAARFGAKD